MKHKIIDTILYDIFNKYLKNENLNFNEMALYLKKKFKLQIINKLMSFNNINNNILEPSISAYKYDPHNFNAYGFQLKNIDKEISLYSDLNLYNSFRFTIKSSNMVTEYTDIIDDNINYFFIEIIIWFKSTNNNDINYYKQILDTNHKTNLYLISTKNIYQEFKYIIDPNKLDNNTPTINKNLIRITSQIMFKFNIKDNVFWNDLKNCLDFENSLTKNNINSCHQKIIDILYNNIINHIIPY